MFRINQDGSLPLFGVQSAAGITCLAQGIVAK